MKSVNLWMKRKPAFRQREVSLDDDDDDDDDFESCLVILWCGKWGKLCLKSIFSSAFLFSWRVRVFSARLSVCVCKRGRKEVKKGKISLLLLDEEERAGRRKQQQKRKHTHKPPTISEEPESLTTQTESGRSSKKYISSASLHDYKFIIIPYIFRTTTSQSRSCSRPAHRALRFLTRKTSQL